MSKPGRAQEYTAPTAEATPLQDAPPVTEPTGSASRDGAATAPPANLDGASPAATAPEAPVSPIPREPKRDAIYRALGGKDKLADMGIEELFWSANGVILGLPRPLRYRSMRVSVEYNGRFAVLVSTNETSEGWSADAWRGIREFIERKTCLDLPPAIRCERCGL